MTDTAPTPRLVKFGLVGVLAALSHYAIMFSGLFFWDAPVIWSFLGAVTGAVVGYFLNYIYTFQSALPHKQTTLQYGVITALSIVLNTGVFFTLSKGLGLYALAAQVVTTIIIFAFNYLAHKQITFNDKTAGSS